MFIRVVDEGLEKMLRAMLPMPEPVGDISFDAPESTWSAQLARITVNAFLYDVSRSSQPSRSLMSRPTANGVGQRRVPQPMIQLSYLISAWAGNPRDEHQLFGDLVSRCAGMQTLPPEFLPSELSSSVDLSFASDDRNKQREIWSGVGGRLKPSFTLQVNLAADTWDWTDQARAVTDISALVPPKPREPPARRPSGLRPPDDERRPRPDGERRPRPPRPDGEARPPRPDGEPRPPRPDGEPRPPRPDGEPRPPRPDGESRPPRPEGEAPSAPRPAAPASPPDAPAAVTSVGE